MNFDFGLKKGYLSIDSFQALSLCYHSNLDIFTVFFHLNLECVIVRPLVVLAIYTTSTKHD